MTEVISCSFSQARGPSGRRVAQRHSLTACLCFLSVDLLVHVILADW